MKKYKAILLTMISAVVGLLAVGCGGKVKDTVKQWGCEHAYGEEITVVTEPTCIEDGEGIVTCTKCGKEKTVTVEKLGHDKIVLSKAVAPTCTTSGLTAKIGCSRCDFIQRSKRIPARGHMYGEDNICTVCGESSQTDSDNESVLIAEGLEMEKGAFIPLTEEPHRDMRFICHITTELYDAVQADENKELAMLVMPIKYCEQVNPNGYTYIDWINEFDIAIAESGMPSYIYFPFHENNIVRTDSGYYMAFRLYNILYKGINDKVMCLGVLKTTNVDGSVDYKYAALPSGETYQSNARSLAYVAAEYLNQDILGIRNLTDKQITTLKGFINESVDKANGLTEPTDDNSTYAFTTSPSAPRTIAVGEGFTVDVEVAPDVDVPIWFRSTDESVVTVDDNGNVVAHKAGTAVVGVYIAGKAVGITVKVV